MREQLTRIVNEVNALSTAPKLDPKAPLTPPTRTQKILLRFFLLFLVMSFVSLIDLADLSSFLRQVIAAGFVDQVARRVPMVDDEGRTLKNRFKFISAVANAEVFVHPSSVMFKVRTPLSYH